MLPTPWFLLYGYYESDKNGFLEESVSLRMLHTVAYLTLFFWGGGGAVEISFGVLYGC